MTFLVIFAVVTVLFMAGVKFTEPDDRDDDPPGTRGITNDHATASHRRRRRST